LELSQPNAALRAGGKPVPDARCPSRSCRRPATPSAGHHPKRTQSDQL